MPIRHHISSAGTKMKTPNYRRMLFFIANIFFMSWMVFERVVASFIASSPPSIHVSGSCSEHCSNVSKDVTLHTGHARLESHAFAFSRIRTPYHSKPFHTIRRALHELRATSSDNLKKSLEQKPKKSKSSKKTLQDMETDASTSQTIPPPFDGLSRLTRAIAKVTDEVKKREQQTSVLKASNLKQKESANTGSRIYYSTLSSKFPRKKVATKKYEDPDIFVSSLTKLTRLLDEKLYTISPRGVSGDFPPLYGVVQSARDNMISLLNYNQVTAESSQKMQDEMNSITYQVVVVFGKHLVREQITLEYATRIKTLIRMFLDDASFKPTLVCFSGDVGGPTPGNLISAADAGYFYFRHLCGIHDIDLQGVNFFLDRYSSHDDDVILRITDQVKNLHVPKWIVNSPFVESHSPNDPSGRSSDRVLERKKVIIHFTLLSTDYHLCNINDVHHRSPRQSLFRAIEAIDDDMKSSKVYQREVNSYTSGNLGKLIHTSWSYQYATYPYIYAKDDVVVFLGKIFLLGEELMPLLANMKGVVEQKEFFQRDNYLMLASIRRSLVSLLESLHQNPKLEMGLQMQIKMKCETKEKDFKASLEGALLSLGRCVDVVKPAGLLLGSVPIADWAKALRALEHTMIELRSLCDPDRPLKQAEWFDNIQEIHVGDIQISD